MSGGFMNPDAEFKCRRHYFGCQNYATTMFVRTFDILWLCDRHKRQYLEQGALSENMYKFRGPKSTWLQQERDLGPLNLYMFRGPKSTWLQQERDLLAMVEVLST